MSSGFMLDYIIMNNIKNKALEYHKEEVDYYFYKYCQQKYISTGGHFKTLTERKALMSVYMFHVYISMLKESE